MPLPFMLLNLRSSVSIGREIVEAFDTWHGKRPPGYVKADRELKRASRLCSQLAAEVAATPATTIEGVRAKLRCVESMGA